MAVSAMAMCAGNLHAETVTWTGGGVLGVMNDSDNWSSGGSSPHTPTLTSSLFLPDLASPLYLSLGARMEVMDFTSSNGAVSTNVALIGKISLNPENIALYVDGKTLYADVPAIGGTVILVR